MVRRTMADRRTRFLAQLVLLSLVIVGLRLQNDSALSATTVPLKEAVCGTWVLRQVATLAELRAARPGIEAALAMPGVTGLSLRVPWKAIDLNFTILEEGLAIARAKGKQLSVRFMAGRHTPARVFSEGSPYYVLRTGEKVPSPFTRTGSPNLVFERNWDALVGKLATWSRANSVRLLHLSWYGQDWAELNHGTEVRKAPGYTYAAWRSAHLRLIDLAAPRSGPDLTVELPLSGYGPLSTGQSATLADRIVTLVGPNSGRFVIQANGWGPDGDWGTTDPKTEADFDKIWEKPILRGEQAIRPWDFDWANLYRTLALNRGLYAEVFDESFKLERSNLLKAEIRRFSDAVCKADVSPPTLVLASTGAVASGTVLVPFEAVDNGYVANVDVLVDGQRIGGGSGLTGTVTWDTTGVADGPHIVSARAIDLAGNVGVSAPLSVLVDNTAPPAPGPLRAVPGNERVTVDFDPLADPDVAHYELQTRRSNSETWLHPVVTTTTSWTFTGLSNGISHDFRARATDRAGLVSAWSEQVAAAPVDAVPSASDDEASTAEDTAVRVEILANDRLGDGAASLVVESQGGRGIATVNPDRTITYRPAPDAFGSDTFSYRLSDEDGDMATAAVHVTVAGVDDVPSAGDDGVSTSEDVAVTIPVLLNDIGLGDGLAGVVVETQGALGLASANGDGTLSYAPAANVHGTDTIRYRVTDQDGDAATATVTVEINPANDPPVAVNDVATTIVDTPVTVAVLRNDFDVDGPERLTVTIEAGPSGSVAVNPDGTISYTPVPGRLGLDVLIYRLTDSGGLFALATVAIDVRPPPSG